MSKRESLSPEIIILEEELITHPDDDGVKFEIVHTGPFLLKQDESLCQMSEDKTPTVPQLPFLYNLIQQATEYPQHLQRMIAEAPAEERAALHTFFLRVATSRKDVS